MDPTYSRARRGARFEGITFQENLISLFILNALRKNMKDWKLPTDNIKAGKFDDLVPEFEGRDWKLSTGNIKAGKFDDLVPEFEGRDWKLSTGNIKAGKFDDLVLEFDGGAILLQAKHKRYKTITLDQLFSTNPKNEDFSLLKYYLSYLEVRSRFPIECLIICTNMSIQADSRILKILNKNIVNDGNILYYQKGCSFYTFSDIIVTDLLNNTKIYYENNLKVKTVDEKLITEESAKEFLKHLRFHVDYPSGNNLKKAIEKRLIALGSFSNLVMDISYQDLHRKVKEWFEQPRREYLTESSTKAMFCQIKSEKHRENLKKYNVLFKNHNLNISNSTKRIFHVVAEGGRLLHLMETYQNIQHSTANILYVGSEFNREVQIEIIKAFQVPRYTFLIIASSQFSEESEISYISAILKQILDSRGYKKIVFVTELNNMLVQRMKATNSNDYYVYDESLTLENLSDETQEMLLKKKSVLFQGFHVSLGELPEQITDDYKRSISLDILEKIITGEKLRVGTSELLEEYMLYYIERNFERMVDRNEIISKGGNMEREDDKQVNENEEIAEGNKIISEEEICQIDDDKIILISDGVGIGRSTAVKNLVIRVKDLSSALWIIRIGFLVLFLVIFLCATLFSNKNN